MRELLFRAWDKQTLKMSPAFALFGEFTLLGAVHDWQHDNGNTAKTSLEALGDLGIMQFTGLKDKNGKDIYEGDIIRVDEREDSIGQVVFDDCEFKLKMIRFKSKFWKLKYKISHRTIKVIGNIYQSPELLKQ